MNTSSSPAVKHPWAAVGAVSLATFSVVTTEMLPVGLLTPVAASLDTSTGTAGLLLSLPALLAALFAPLVVLAAGGTDRRTLLCGLLGLMVLANASCALAPDMGWMLAARVLVGFCIGGIWAIAGGLAARLVPAHHIGLATAIIFGGVAAASVMGVPLGAAIGGWAGWRWAFGAMALFSALVLALHLAVTPRLPAGRPASLSQFREQLGNRALLAGLLLTLLLVAAHFMAFTFVRPLLTGHAGFDAHWLGALLFGYGVAGIGGNFVAGLAAARHIRPTLIAIAAGLTLTPLLFLAVGDSAPGGGAALLFWGLAYGGVSVAVMNWMMQAAPRAIEIASAMCVTVFNSGIALGAWAGGRVVDHLGIVANLWAAAGIAGAALAVALALTRTRTGQGDAARAAPASR
ncbi:MFS transporter [Bordetella genomosp. 1]|uniref:MFS transporter n=1 Tax=Bordetella genomosp. 1 TaxID=1395607 RepID=A0A261SFQ6_9BORD|nr:MFS transporter [Bordetella genomosp. 1]OZI36224.1 MFS transporter [Bordetella genomosp. 1]